MPEIHPTEIYLIRHAETVMNTNPDLVGGLSHETPLTPKGINQAKRLGRVMLAKKILPTRIFASPSLRALDTAQYSLIEMGLDVQPLIVEAIQELDQGSAEGKSRTEVFTDDVLKEIAKVGKAFKLDGGESMDDVGRRMHTWITETFTQPNVGEAQRYFVYTHGGSIKYLASRLLGWDELQTYQTQIDNTSVNLFTMTDGAIELEYLNRDVEEI